MYLQQIGSGKVKIKTFERYGVTVHVYGDTATAMGSTRLDIELDGQSRKVDLAYLNVWVKRDGRWQLAARQSAFKPAPK
jgi:ketosteroid isomerase-like protein